jgi:hypothetical protein
MANQDPNDEENFDDLFVDGNLFSVFRSAPTIFANTFNWVASALACAGLVAFSLSRLFCSSQAPPVSFVATFATWANVGWTLSSTLLGFLVAGFALLCTVLRPSAVLALHRYYDPGDANNRLRNLFISFVDIFITYLSLLLFSLGMVIVTSPNGPSLELRNLFLLLGPKGPMLVGYLVFISWGTWFAIVVLKLKSFVYNLYQALMVGMTESVHSATECANMVTDHRPASHVDGALPAAHGEREN